MRLLSPALVLALAAFTSGCELVIGTDASLDDSSLPEAGTGDAALQDDAAMAPGDAAPPVQTDAGDLDSGGRDGGANLDAQAPLDASDADASSRDAGGFDSGGRDGGANLDAQAPLDASDADANSHDADAGGFDSGGRDGGANLDAQAPLDASDADASSHDATAPSEAGNDAGLLTRTRSGEVRWVINENQGSLFCPQQSMLLWKEETISLRDPSALGFTCEICPNPPYDDNGVTAYSFHSDELEVRLDFRSSIARGYSLAGFRDGLQFATLSWKTNPKSPTREGWTRFSTWSDQPTVEFLSYEEPLLHVRLQVVVFETAVSFYEPATIPFLCFHQTPAGPIPDVCTEAICGFKAPDADPGNGVHVTVDITLPMQAPHDGPSP